MKSIVNELQRRKEFDESWEDVRFTNYPLWILDHDVSPTITNRWQLVTTRSSEPVLLFEIGLWLIFLSLATIAAAGIILSILYFI